MNYIQFEGRDLEQSAWCSMPYHEEYLDNIPLYVQVAATFLYFVIPFAIVLFLYLRLGSQLCSFKYNLVTTSEIRKGQHCYLLTQ